MIKRKIKNNYNREDAWKDRGKEVHHWQRTEQKKIADLLSEKCNISLDIGSGRGDFLPMLLDVSKKVFALDFAEKLLKYSKKEIGSNRVSHICGDAEKIPFSSNTFDLVLGIQVIGHTSNPNIMLKEINRVLKKGGILILSTGNPLSFSHIWKTTYRILEKRFENFSKFLTRNRKFWIKEQGHIRDSYFDLKEKLQKSGFRIEEVEGAGTIRSRWWTGFIEKIDDYISSQCPFNYLSSLIIIKSIKNKK